MQALSYVPKDGRLLKRSRRAPAACPSAQPASPAKNPFPAGAAARPLRQAAIRQLQQTHGNRAVQRLLQRRPAARVPSLQRCGGTTHAGCRCCDGQQQEERQVDLQRRPAVQRLTAVERQQDLQSSKYAANQRLQRAFDNLPALSIGERGEAVRLVQEGLVEAGFPLPGSTKPDGRLDGIFGRETYAAVKAFQTQHGLGVDGLVGRETLGQLDQMAGSPPGGDLPECALEEGQGGAPEASFLDGQAQAGPESKQGQSCQVKKPVGIRPKPGHPPTDFHNYECESRHTIKVHAYVGVGDSDSFGANAKGAINTLQNHNMEANFAGSSLMDPDAPVETPFSGTVDDMLELCRVIRATVKAQSPTPGFLPAFFVRMGPKLKSGVGLETIAGVHLKDLDGQCAELKEKTGLGQVILIDSGSGCDIPLIHEIVHAAGFSGHDTGSGSEKNIMAPAGCSLAAQPRLTHHQVRKLCNASF